MRTEACDPPFHTAPVTSNMTLNYFDHFTSARQSVLYIVCACRLGMLVGLTSVTPTQCRYI